MNGNYRSQWYRPNQKKQTVCAIGIHGQSLWIDRAARLVIVKMASNGKVVDIDNDLVVLDAINAITKALD